MPTLHLYIYWETVSYKYRKNGRKTNTYCQLWRKKPYNFVLIVTWFFADKKNIKANSNNSPLNYISFVTSHLLIVRVKLETKYFINISFIKTVLAASYLLFRSFSFIYVIELWSTDYKNKRNTFLFRDISNTIIHLTLVSDG